MNETVIDRAQKTLGRIVKLSTEGEYSTGDKGAAGVFLMKTEEQFASNRWQNVTEDQHQANNLAVVMKTEPGLDLVAACAYVSAAAGANEDGMVVMSEVLGKVDEMLADRVISDIKKGMDLMAGLVHTNDESKLEGYLNTPLYNDYKADNDPNGVRGMAFALGALIVECQGWTPMGSNRQDQVKNEGATYAHALSLLVEARKRAFGEEEKAEEVGAKVMFTSQEWKEGLK